MKWVLRALGVVLVLAIAAGIYLVATGQGMLIAMRLGGPDYAFDASRDAPPPDYAQVANWAALPTTEDLADLVPEGVARREGPAPVAAFFIHPTGYISAKTWNSPMDPNSITEDNTRWMMANQASAYNSCCDVYAPRYREAAIHAFFADEATKAAALELAYSDVERAFDHFLETFAAGRPFLIASHSQGSYHGMTLIERRIDGTALAERMVAAYLIGVPPPGPVNQARVGALKSVRACDGPDDTGCLVHFATYAEDASAEENPGSPMVCTNPLTWQDEGARAEADVHKGAVAVSGDFTIKPFAKDIAEGVTFGPLGAPLPGLTHAACEGGILRVKSMRDGPFGNRFLLGGNYHGLDYPLFHMDIRENAKARVEAFLAAEAAASSNEAAPQ